MPVNYNQAFIDAFKGYESYYVLIGGTATSIVLDASGLESRTTKDYDMVIIDDKKNRKFHDVLEKFLIDGEYTPSTNEKDAPLYRFTTKKEGFPKMLELFSIKPEYPLNNQERTTPVSFDEGYSLSALLLDEDYYELLLLGKELINGYSVLNNQTLIVFKAKAWLDMSVRKEEGQKVDSKDIKKHLNDISRLAGSLKEIRKMDLALSIHKDMKNFLSMLSKDISQIPKNSDIILEPKEVYEVLEELLG
jgi:hypothetical protein